MGQISSCDVKFVQENIRFEENEWLLERCLSDVLRRQHLRPNESILYIGVFRFIFIIELEFLDSYHETKIDFCFQKQF